MALSLLDRWAMSSQAATVLAVITLVAGFVLAHAAANPASALSLRPRHDPAAMKDQRPAANVPPAPAPITSATGPSASR